VKILLDENLPRKLVAALRAERHDVESVHTLRMQGLDYERLYEFAQTSFDICFTRDNGFANNVRRSQASQTEAPSRNASTKTTGGVRTGLRVRLLRNRLGDGKSR
jgi:Domain of unknown function (DUF5615)